MNQPAKIPLVTPGMPWISVTLLAAKYLSQVALRSVESQNMRHSWVVTVPLAVSTVLAHTSNVFHTKVRLPNMHTLEITKSTKCQRRCSVWPISVCVWCSDFFSNDPIYSITKCRCVLAIGFDSIQHYSSRANLNSKLVDEQKVNTRALSQRIQPV